MEVETELAAEPTSVSDSQQQGELAVTDSAKHETRRDVDPRHSIVSCDQSNGARPLLPVRGGKLQQSDTLKPRDPFEQKGWVKSWRRVEVVLLSGCIVIVWGLLFLPVVFYHLPTEEVGGTDGCTVYSTSNDAGQVCQDVIHTLHGDCLPNSTSVNTTDVLISPRDRTQQELEDILTIGIRVVSPSPQCEEVIVPFLCLYYLRPCDGGGEVTYRPSVEDCVTVSTEICPREWAETDDLLSNVGESLPSCEEIANEKSTQCDFVENSGYGLGNDSLMGGSAVQPVTSSPTTTPENSTDSEAEACTVYTGSVCSDQLLSLQNCIPEREGSQMVYISSDIDQTATESQVTLIQGGLSILSPSTECLDAVVPFLCLYYFGLCDSSGNLFEPSTETCATISTDICQREWTMAENLIALPTCDMFGEQLTACNGTGLAINATNETASSSSSSCPRECRDEFYCASGLCRPRCDKWQLRPKSEQIAIDVVTALSAIIGLSSGTLVLVISWIRRKQMCTLPSVIIVYQTITLMILASVVLMVYVDRDSLLCSRVDLEDSIEHSTVFCAISGAVFHYTMLQMAVWWLLYVLMLLWTVRFPLQVRSFGKSHWFKVLHIACVTLALLVPLIPVIAAFATGGFNNTNFPPHFCTGRDSEATFYSLMVPIMIVLQIGVAVLTLIFWTLHKQKGLFTLKPSKVPAPMRLGTPEKKILIASCYYVLLGVIALSAFTNMIRNGEAISEEFDKYFLCESGGIDPDDPEQCDRSGFEQYQIPGLTATASVLIGMFPVVNVVFAVNVKDLKQFFRRFRKPGRITDSTKKSNV